LTPDRRPRLHRGSSFHPAVNFINNLRADFTPNFFQQKITNPNCKHMKDAHNTFVQKTAHKMLVNNT